MERRRLVVVAASALIGLALVLQVLTPDSPDRPLLDLQVDNTTSTVPPTLPTVTTLPAELPPDPTTTAPPRPTTTRRTTPTTARRPTTTPAPRRTTTTPPPPTTTSTTSFNF